MSFIYNYFSCDNSTPSEKENAAALKTIIETHKSALKFEIKQYETNCKQVIKEAEDDYKRVKKQAEEDMYRKTLEAVKREVDIITTTDEYANSDAKTKAKIAQFQSWVGCAGMWRCGASACGMEEKKKEQEVVKTEVIFDEKQQERQELPLYQDDTSYTNEKDTLLSA
ncbi:hypothetical protein BGZ97_011215 [Linnemannia gamsii]|jgi:hypothetical protein|uniref:Uncharacterized protein n=1 Tax=Linnemannia gamsii TaxID=64522 RepID=A0A9P6R5L7_9FUNG|nr:hypothetical protein BGZ97_011215 [Linnemannia gamsii]